MKHDYIQNLLTFNPTHRLRVCVRTESVFALCSILHSLFDMHHHYFQKKMFWPLTPPQRSSVYVRTEYVLAPESGGALWAKWLLPWLLHSWFHLILRCNMTMFWKSWILTISWKNECCPFVRGLQIFATVLLHPWFHLVWYATWPCSEKKLKFDLLTPPQGSGWGAEGKIFATLLKHASFPLIWYATWPFSERLEFWPLSHPLSPPRRSAQGLWSLITFYMFYIYCTCVCMRNFS